MENWRNVVGYEEFYEVSDMGNIRNRITGKILLNSAKKNGYMAVDLGYIGKKTINVHRIVAMAFIGNENNFPCVNHINENKHDNRACNLEWCTYKYNANYGVGALARNTPVAQMDKFGAIVKLWDSMKDVESALGIKYQCISAVCRGVRRTTGGFCWKYINC